MDKHSKRSSSLLHYPVLVVFSLFFIGLFALDLITPDRAYSEMENTTLSQRPALTQLSAKGLNSYFTAYTKYVKDQVFGRDDWISLGLPPVQKTPDTSERRPLRNTAPPPERTAVPAQHRGL